ncbi:tetratricopeptide repeat protein [Cellulophaga omnivescoria]|uniref:tetratricopeptide repeat protein n=1 Tax=Cellulophaga omnivescoria TaxID=1888890 RepID=UPI0022F013BE|nr:tetratricopeptide repeat protein [Cellulophaga omnivescoria]WBU90570.1 tetratricopeptide repeat protein [Cellulophaga omnivescoria]
MKKFIMYLLLFATVTVNAQEDLTPGFKMLEKGNFKEAKTFFKPLAEANPTNKTILICYGRAVGLSGEPKVANTIFKGLLEKHPNDFEVQINYYESFLWSNEFKEAKPLYSDLVKNNPENFAAILGYANTLSNLKEYKEALKWVNKAIEVDPDNNSAKVSKKYIKLGYANYYVNNQNYKKGEILLKEILKDFKDDKDALLNLANIYLITKEVNKAKSTYYQYAKTPKDTVTALIGIALSEHIGEKDKIALETAINAKQKATNLDDFELIEKSSERYVQALIWNNKFLTARKEIEILEEKYPNRNWVRSLKATLGMYTSKFKTSITNYNAILSNDSTSFDGNLGKANALFASDKIVPAYVTTYKTLEIFPKQKDATGLIKKLNKNYTPFAEQQLSYTFDNGDNTAISLKTSAIVPLSTKFKTTVSYQYRTTENTTTKNKATAHLVQADVEYKLMPKTNLLASAGFNNSRFSSTSYTQPILQAKLQTKPLSFLSLDLGYQREVQSFNAELIEREIVMNHYSLVYNLSTNFNLGWYTQFIHTQQTDNNERNLLFTSLYYNVLKKPALKFGVNYQYLTFKDQLPLIYFSPETYKAFELFGDVRGKINEKTNYFASAATGLQYVEEQDASSLFRAEAGLTHKFSERFIGDVYGKYSNIASATAAGFEFTEVGIKLKYYLTKKPLFLDKLKKQYNIK